MYLNINKISTKKKTFEICFMVFLLLISFFSFSQETFPINDVKKNFYPTYAFTNATIQINPEKKIDKGTLIIKKNKIIAVGEELDIPNNAIVKNLNGKYIYASFIDLYSNYGVKESSQKNESYYPQYESNAKGAFGWNEAVKSHVKAYEIFKKDEKNAKKMRNYGFGSVLTHNHDGVFRGSGCLVSLGQKKENELILNKEISSHLSLNKGKSKQIYPRSLMGIIALIKQSLLDAEWYSKGGKKEQFNLTLESIKELESFPQIIEANNKLDILRISKIAEDFEIDFIVKGNGDEYQRIQNIKKLNFKYIIPVNFPKAYEIKDIYDEEKISLGKLKHWETSTHNPSILKKQKIDFCITSYGLSKDDDFLKNIKKTINSNFTESDLLASLTTKPAKFINEGERLGTIEKGKFANFLIVSDNIFTNGIIEENWIQGVQHVINISQRSHLKGKYDILNLETNNDNNKYALIIESVKKGKFIINDSINKKIDLIIEGNHISFTVKINSDYLRFFGLMGKNNDNKNIINGEYKDEYGVVKNWRALYKMPLKKEQNNKKENAEKNLEGKIWLPNKSYGWDSLPKQQNIYFKNATIWTNEKEGIIKNANMIIYDGKILYVGEKEPEEEITKNKIFEIVDVKGKHITSGIIDEHSHIAIHRGVNEGSQAVTAEVSIGDVINSDDINIYRQLSGGVTSAQLLHGSANPIGGQSAIIKLKWGLGPEEMKFKGAGKFIKFALGENVKQSNWGDDEKYRFPQSRMGVEQVFYDAFWRAKQYEKKWENYNSLPFRLKKKTTPPREDLELNVLLEILNKKRFITCHSYVQSEINMLMKVADSMNFKINIFTHILEGYKVADKLKEHGAGGSTFSDWWAYKFEVNDAIPYNAALLSKMGVLTAINSDDAEMGRRLNQEAAKAIKYGNLKEEEAWKLVTLNPAKMLKIDDKVGSIKIGKDADIVVWSGNPLSMYSKAEKTFIDGKCFFSIENDKKLRERNQNEKSRIIQIMLKDDSPNKQKPKFGKQKLYHCDTLEP